MPPKSLKLSPLVMSGALVLIVASIYWARPVLIPVALAMLLTFLLSPADSALQRLGLGRAVSVALLAIITFSLIGVIGWAISVQVKEIAKNLPSYQGNIKKRIEDLQVGQGTTLDKVRIEFEQLIGDVTTNAPSTEQARQPVLVAVQGGRFSSGIWQFSPMIQPLLESLFYILLVATLVIFMLLERDELRNRAIRLLGYGRLSLATQALDEAGQRVSRYLFAQFIVNACLGVVIGLGLFLLGVPYALLWGFLIIFLRFVPYIGIWIAAILPFAVSLATSSNWWQPLSVIALFAVLEPIAALVIEPMLFSQSAGTSKLAMLIAIAFWTWLWGPVGLLLATPLTACLAVVAKYVPQLEFIAVLLGDEPVMQTSVSYYQHLLTMDQDEAEAIVEEQLRTHPVGHVFDEVLIPALHYAKRDSRLGVLTDDEQEFIYRSTREIIERIGLPSTHPTSLINTAASTVSVNKIRILAWPAHDEADAIALLMLQQLLDPTRYEVEISPAGKRLPEILQEVEQKSPALFCVGFIPPGGLSASRHVSKLLRARLPELTIVAGHWGLLEKVHNDREALLAAGATHVTATLIETRDQIVQALHPRVKLQPDAAVS
ncbi:MAG TPA: AI-2E family transporter [Verrucomicrobiae bacterium]|nr:AI-2E family transporter [Verrucomicrobiae bacterium]